MTLLKISTHFLHCRVRVFPWEQYLWYTYIEQLRFRKQISSLTFIVSLCESPITFPQSLFVSDVASTIAYCERCFREVGFQCMYEYMLIYLNSWAPPANTRCNLVRQKRKTRSHSLAVRVPTQNMKRLRLHCYALQGTRTSNDENKTQSILPRLKILTLLSTPNKSKR